MSLDLQQKIQLNQFIAKIGIWYNNKIDNYQDLKGNVIKDCTKYLKTAFQNVFKRFPNSREIAYIQDWLYMPFDFESVPYRTYLKQLVQHQNPSLIKKLKDNYSYYLESIQKTGKSKSCIYITGEAGTGKTTYAKILASKYYNEDEIYVTSGGQNPFDEYYGEKCIIIDDFRDSTMCYNDLLKLLDNNTSSNVGARYHNKSLARCELIILTSVKTLPELYQGINEERYQLYRRVKYFGLTKNSILYYLNYNKNTDYFDVKDSVSIKYFLDDYYEKHNSDTKINVDDIFQDITNDELQFELKKIEEIYQRKQLTARQKK